MGPRVTRIATAVSALIFLAAVGFWWTARERAASIDLPAVRARIESVETLRTTEFVYREIVYFDEQTRILGVPAGGRRVLFSVVVTVTAGVDLAAGVEVSREPDGATVLVTLPAPTVLSVDADEQSIDQYFVRERFGRLDWRDVSRTVERIKEQNRADALERGILDRAEVHARAAIAEIVAASGADTIRVRFRPSVLRG